MIPFADTLRRMVALFEACGVAYAVIGGMAIVARVRMRTTGDIDAIVAASPLQMDAVARHAGAFGFELDTSQPELAALGLCKLLPLGGADGPTVDILLPDNAFETQLLVRATALSLAGQQVQVATAEDLLLLKLAANRNVDIEDVFAIKDALGSSLNMPYVRQQAAILRVTDRLELYFGRG